MFVLLENFFLEGWEKGCGGWMGVMGLHEFQFMALNMIDKLVSST